MRAGEIVGIAGVAGNGQSELAQVITGLRPHRGLISVAGEESPSKSAADVIRRGVAHVPEDRTGVGSAPNLSVTDNLIMKRYRSAPVGHGWVIDTTAAHKVAEGLRVEYQISTPSVDTAVRLLSGGNLQRLILAREIDLQPRLMVAVQPTRGLDVGAIEAVHRLLLARRDSGCATVLVSEDLDEILALADRVAVMYEGRLHGPFDAAVVDVNGLGIMMTGGEWEPAGAGGTAAAPRRRARRGTGARPGRGGRSAPGARPGLAADRPAGPGSVSAGAAPSAAGGRRWSLRLERRLEPPAWTPLISLVAVLVALVISGLIIAAVGGDPIRSYAHIFNAAFGSIGVISDTLVKATPLILTGLACALAFRMRLWNIGAEGQLLMGAWAASAVVLAPLLPAGTPALILLPAMMVAGFAGGAALGPHPGRPQGVPGGQRDHRHPDAQLRRPALDPVLGLRAVERGRLPDDPPVPQGGLAPPPHRLRHGRAGVRRPDRPPRPRRRGRRRRDPVVRPRPEPAGAT